MKLKWLLIFFFLFNKVYAAELPLNLLKLPPHFFIETYAYPVKDAREMVLGNKGTLFVGSREAGNVYAIVKDATRPYGTRVITIASNLNMPNGVAFKNDALYVAEIHRVLRFDHIEDHLTNPPKPVVVSNALPNKQAHGWRFIRFGPDGKLYLGIGAPCNACLSEDPRFASIMRMNPDGSQFEIFAQGVRNTVGFDWDPRTQQLWFTDNGRDMMGDDVPPDELNVAPHAGLHFGFPFFHGKNIPDPTFGKMYPITRFTPPVLEFTAHAATLGMTFYTGNMFPAEYKNQIFIAEHGSWNRSTKVGYQVVSVKIDNHHAAEKPFITGWLQDGKVWGRPVATIVLPDGSLLVSDDYADVVYRVYYKN